MKNKIKQLLKVQEKLREMGYMANIDTRMGLQRMHVWNIRRGVSIPQIQKLIGEEYEYRKHAEIGVWVQIP